LREFIHYLEDKGQLIRVKTEADPILEITEITDRVSKKRGPALIFENPKGSRFPVAINLFGSYERTAWALGFESFSEIEKFIPDVLSIIPGSLREALAKISELSKFRHLKPKVVKNAPSQEVVYTEDADLFSLPILKCWPEDGGRFITLPLVITKDPETGIHNIGMYRMQIYNSKTTGMHWHIHHDGAQNFLKSDPEKPFEVAVALGGEPALIYAATAPLPHNVSEYMLAGILNKRPVELVKAKTVDLLVPANAEIIIEGYVLHGETRLEGPFGDHTGYYSLEDYYPVFHVTAITHRKDAIYPTTIVGKPPMEDCYLGKATERLFLPVIKQLVPEVIDIDMPLEGVFHNCVIVSIDKTYPKQAFKVMNALWSLGQMMFSKFIVVVDKDVNVHDYSEVTWRVFNNVDPKRDILITEGPLDVLDHSSPDPYYGHKMGIDATRKMKEEGHPRKWPKDIEMTEEIKKLVDSKWSDYGIEI
jgi:4-hydroxy-3-polyprenylbenzoate decarboxylase